MHRLKPIYKGVGETLIDEVGDIRFFGAGSGTIDASCSQTSWKTRRKYKPKVQLEAMFNCHSDDELEQIAANKSPFLTRHDAK